jgi:iron only hydrogenase large subunit-like protein
VCYAEKTHGSLVIPHISTTKSPQQIMGSLVKDHLALELGKTPDSVYHVTLMPCYDKKLEASREDFTNQQLHTRDVDCVITASERILILIFHMHSSIYSLMLQGGKIVAALPYSCTGKEYTVVQIQKLGSLVIKGCII